MSDDVSIAIVLMLAMGFGFGVYAGWSAQFWVRQKRAHPTVATYKGTVVYCPFCRKSDKVEPIYCSASEADYVCWSCIRSFSTGARRAVLSKETQDLAKHLRGMLVLLFALVPLFGCQGSPLSPSSPVVQASSSPAPRASSCISIVERAWFQGGASGRSDFVGVRFEMANTCDRRVRVTGNYGFGAEVDIYDNLTRSGTPLGRGFVDPFEIAAQTRATVEALVILDRGTRDDIPGDDAVILLAIVEWA